jgi:hypothetical protein
VGVAWQGSSSDYQEFIQRHSLTFANIDDSSADVYGSLQITGQPAWAMVRADGETEVFRGVLSDDELAEQITLLSQP